MKLGQKLFRKINYLSNVDRDHRQMHDRLAPQSRSFPEHNLVLDLILHREIEFSREPPNELRRLLEGVHSLQPPFSLRLLSIF